MEWTATVSLNARIRHEDLKRNGGGDEGGGVTLRARGGVLRSDSQSVGRKTLRIKVSGRRT